MQINSQDYTLETGSLAKQRLPRKPDLASATRSCFLITTDLLNFFRDFSTVPSMEHRGIQESMNKQLPGIITRIGDRKQKLKVLSIGERC